MCKASLRAGVPAAARRPMPVGTGWLGGLRGFLGGSPVPAPAIPRASPVRVAQGKPRVPSRRVIPSPEYGNTPVASPHQPAAVAFTALPESLEGPRRPRAGGPSQARGMGMVASGIVEALQQVAIFQGLAAHQLEALAEHSERVKFQAD